MIRMGFSDTVMKDGSIVLCCGIIVPSRVTMMVMRKEFRNEYEMEFLCDLG